MRTKIQAFSSKSGNFAQVKIDNMTPSDKKNDLPLPTDNEGAVHATKPKNSRRVLIFYVSLLALFIAFVWFTATIVAPKITNGTNSVSSGLSAFDVFKQGVEGHVSSTLGMLLIQVITILIVARLIGWLFTKIKQPTVIGEIVAGIMLGPSLLGIVWPEAFEALFPTESIQYLELLSNFGLILFMFTIGMELRIADIRSQARDALVISQSSIFIPFILGMTSAIALYNRYSLTVPFLSYGSLYGYCYEHYCFSCAGTHYPGETDEPNPLWQAYSQHRSCRRYLCLATPCSDNCCSTEW